MKKGLLLLLFFTAPLFAQFEGVKIMVNPGHGGNDSNDRYIPATGFWESEGNLTKGLHLRDLLEARGAEVVMSRTQNRTEDDLPLSQISAIANENNVDFFHSIHSNAANANANYTLMLYEEIPGTNGTPEFALAKVMCDIMGPELHHVNYTTTTYTRGDYSFLGFNLGVLRNLEMPGTLSEGSFHDYVNESWRLQNHDYRRHEAVAMLRAMLDYFELPDLDYGAVAGIARDNTRLTSYGYNTSLPNDRFVPINNVLASLYQEDSLLRTFKGDFNNNGYFVFDSVDTGDYTLIVDYGEYVADTVAVTVTANRTAFKELFPAKTGNKSPRVFGTNPQEGAGNIGTYSSFEITFSQSMNTSSVVQALSIAPYRAGNLSWREGNRIMVFTPDSAFNTATQYTVTVDSSAKGSNGQVLGEDFSFAFTTAAQHVRPVVLSTKPAQNDSIPIDRNVEIVFDQAMNRDAVRKAFTIEPQAEGNFQWYDGDTRLVFNPDSLLQANTHYTITLSDSALNSFYVGLADTFVYEFRTRKFNEVVVLESFPADGAGGIGTMAEVVFMFGAIVDANSVVNKVEMFEVNGDQLVVRSWKLEQRGTRTALRFEPRTGMEAGRTYLARLLPGIQDEDGLSLLDTVEITFTTDTETYVSGTIVENFNTTTGWKKPQESDKTYGIDSALSTFGLSSLERMSGTSGRFYTTFTQDSAYAFVGHDSGIVVPTSTVTEFGVWVFGDYSKNHLELAFAQGGDTLTYKTAIDFSGWKLLRFDLDGSQGAPVWTSIALRRAADGEAISNIFVEDGQYDVVTGLDDPAVATVRSVELHANYPNPFNPATKIGFELPMAANVKLEVFDILGRRVAILIDAPKEAGSHVVRFDGKGLASGIYYYRLQTGAFVQTRKMVLVK